jgi:hypothetical protein
VVRTGSGWAGVVSRIGATRRDEVRVGGARSVVVDRCGEGGRGMS